jgi:hypothetical protein
VYECFLFFSLLFITFSLCWVANESIFLLLLYIHRTNYSLLLHVSSICVCLFQPVYSFYLFSLFLCLFQIFLLLSHYFIFRPKSKK